jgi:hypothetical protein
MKIANRVCENCGEEILADAPKGLCPACILETGLGPLADETVAEIDSSAVVEEDLLPAESSAAMTDHREWTIGS